ncbi:MAG: hypothetical protein LBR39_02735 [Coriobacteriales bacterium]|jgi:hypothetical protein|nr:hypothetical protein [Coriobacteriales bacterium]
MNDARIRAFQDFLDSDVHDRAEQSLFDITKTAFEAGWQEALGFICREVNEIRDHPSQQS